MEAVLVFIFKLYVATVLGSVGIKLAKEYFANKKIEKQGLEITNGDREPQEVAYDIIKEYAFSLVPIRNVKKAWKLIWSNNKKYASAKLDKLQKEGRIKKMDEVVAEPIPEETKPKKEEKPVVTNDTKKNNQLIVDQYIAEINNSTNIDFIKALKTTYRQKSIELRKKHAKLKEMLKTSTNEEFKKNVRKEMNGIARRVKVYDEIFVAARDRLFELNQKQTSAQRKK